VSFGDVSKAAGLGALDTFLKAHSYVEGFRPSQADAAMLQRVGGAVDSKSYPSVARWHQHISSFPAAKRSAWPGQKDEKAHAPAPAAPAAAAAAAAPSKGAPGGAPAPADEDDGDPFKEKPKKAAAAGEERSPFDDDEEQTEEEKRREEELNARAKKLMDERALKGKKKELARSTLILDVKPNDSDTDMKVVEDFCRAIEMEGLRWAGSELVPVGYGIKKLRIIAVIVDDLVSTDVLREKIEAKDDLVQSTDIFAFNKV